MSRKLTDDIGPRRTLMSEPPKQDATRDESDDELADVRDPQGHGGMPRWVKVMGIVALLVVVAVVVLMAVAGGDHGPGRHLPGGDKSTPTSAGHTPPPGVDH